MLLPVLPAGHAQVRVDHFMEQRLHQVPPLPPLEQRLAKQDGAPPAAAGQDLEAALPCAPRYVWVHCTCTVPSRPPKKRASSCRNSARRSDVGSSSSHAGSTTDSLRGHRLALALAQGGWAARGYHVPLVSKSVSPRSLNCPRSLNSLRLASPGGRKQVSKRSLHLQGPALA